MGAAVVLLVGTVLFALREGPLRFDSAIYWNAAVDLWRVPAHVFTLRIGLTLPVRAAVRVFGPSEAALYAVPLATGMLLAGAVYGTMLVLFRDRVLAVLAAVLAALNANLLLFSSFLFPDTTATATFTAGMLCLVLGARRAEPGSKYASGFAALAGALFGWTYLTREFSPLLLLPAVVGAVALLRYPPRRVLLLFVGAVAAASIEILYGAVRYGEPFIHLDYLLGRPEAPVSDRHAPRVAHTREQLTSLLDTVVVFPRLLLAWETGWVFLLLVAIFLVALVAARDRRLWLLGVWFLSFWAIMAVIGVGSLPSGRWILNITNIRYWYPIFPPLAMGALGGLSLLLRGRNATAWRTRLTYLVATSLTALAVVPGAIEYRRCAASDIWPPADPLAAWHDVREWLGTPEADRYDVVWTDINTRRYLSAFTSTPFGERLWRGRREHIPYTREGIARATGSQRSVILVNRQRPPRDPDVVDELRRRWSPIFVSGDEMMVVLAPRARASRPATTVAWWSRPEFTARRLEASGCGLNPYNPPSWRR